MKEQLKVIQDATEKQVRLLSAWRKAIQELAVELNKSEPDAAIMRAAADRLQGWADAFPGQRQAWSALAAEIHQRYEDLALRYESLLRERCAAAGFTVIGRSPDLTIDGLVKVHIDTARNHARVNDKRVSPMAVAHVVDAVTAEVARLWARPFDAAEFLGRLRAAHRSAAGPDGGPAPARAVYNVLAAEDRAYKLDMFAADLARWSESSRPPLAEVEQPILAPSRDTRQAVWVVGRRGEDGRYVGLIDFKSRPMAAEEEPKE